MRKVLVMLVMLLGLAVVPATASALKFEPAPGTPMLPPADPGPPEKRFVPVDVSAGYFNDDGYEDIAVVSDVTKNIYVYLGQSDGSLVPSASNPIGANSDADSSRLAVHAADLDNDGDSDLATVDYSFPAHVEVYLNGRDGGAHESFGTTPDSDLTLPDGTPWTAGYVSSYFTDDGEYLVLGLGSNSYVYLHNDNGAYEMPVDPVSIDTADKDDRALYSTTIGDFNGDGHHDLALVSEPGYSPDDPQPTRLYFAAGNSDDETFAAPTEIVPAAADKYLSNVRAADLNGDQYQDLIFRQEVDNVPVTMIALGSASGPVLQESSGSSPDLPGGLGPSIADFNDDGKKDVALPQFGDESFEVALGDGQGHLALDSGGPFALPSINGHEFYPQRSTALDVNGDGRLDLAAVSGHSGAENQARGVAVMLARGSSGIVVSPLSIDFGQVPADGELIAPVPVTIQSNGELPLDLGDISFNGPETDGFRLDRGDCPNGALASGSSCTLQVSMSQSQFGYFNGYLGITSDATAEPIQIEVIGQVKEPEPLASALKLKVKSARKIKAGTKLLVTAIVRNAGPVRSVHFNLKANAPKKLAGKARPTLIRNVSVAAGHASTFKFRIPVKQKAKGRTFRVKVSLTAEGRTIRKLTGKIKVPKAKKKPRRR